MRINKRGGAASPLAVTFLGLLAAGTALFWALPKTSFSENEKRALADPPALTLSSLEDGSFSSGAENYLADHFPARLTLVGLHAYAALACGLNGESGVYAGHGGNLSNVPISVDAANFSRNLASIASFSKKTDIPACLMAVPTAGGAEPERLPAVHAPYPDRQLLAQAKTETAGATEWVDLSALFSDVSGKSGLFYRTDHHWTSAGVYLAYRSFCSLRGLTALPAAHFTVKTFPGFYGTAYSKSGLWGTAPDALSVWQDKSLRVRVSIRDDGAGLVKESDSMYDWSELAHEDKYPVFLDGNHSLVTIENPAAPDRTLLLIKDSYADSLAPFLAEHYRKIDLVDLRYFRLETVSSLAKREKPDELLFVYGLDSLVNDRNIALLA